MSVLTLMVLFSHAIWHPSIEPAAVVALSCGNAEINLL